jgi:hypothetical protein
MLKHHRFNEPAKTKQTASTRTTASATTSTNVNRVVPVDVSALAKRSSFSIYEIVSDRCSLIENSNKSNPNHAVPVASVFKLWVLDALARSVEQGATSWDDNVTIRDELRSDPSGEVFQYPQGKNVSVKRLAELMISISDNTAADHLIDLLGRKEIEAIIGELAPDGAERTLPLLSTADMSRLKFAHPDLGREYLALTPPRRSEYLVGLRERGPLPTDPTELAKLNLVTPNFVDDIEWFASSADLCRTMADLARLSRKPGLEPINEILSINNGLPPQQATQWDTKWFKGGSEPGVVALVYRLAKPEVNRVVVLTLSNPNEPLQQRIDGEKIIASIFDRTGK